MSEIILIVLIIIAILGISINMILKRRFWGFVGYSALFIIFVYRIFIWLRNLH